MKQNLQEREAEISKINKNSNVTPCLSLQSTHKNVRVRNLRDLFVLNFYFKLKNLKLIE